VELLGREYDGRGKRRAQVFPSGAALRTPALQVCRSVTVCRKSVTGRHPPPRRWRVRRSGRFLTPMAGSGKNKPGNTLTISSVFFRLAPPSGTDFSAHPGMKLYEPSSRTDGRFRGQFAPLPPHYALPRAEMSAVRRDCTTPGGDLRPDRRRGDARRIDAREADRGDGPPTDDLLRAAAGGGGGLIVGTLPDQKGTAGIS
jgi:hypothetical protein